MPVLVDLLTSALAAMSTFFPYVTGFSRTPEMYSQTDPRIGIMEPSAKFRAQFTVTVLCRPDPRVSVLWR